MNTLVSTTNKKSNYLSKAIASALFSFTFIVHAASPIPRIFTDNELTQKVLIGNVFLDLNGDGVQSTNERGVIGVRIISVSGLVLETDENGHFHLPESGIKTQNTILKLDVFSLPQGAIVTTENPRIIRTSNTGLNKFNFGVKF